MVMPGDSSFVIFDALSRELCVVREQAHRYPSESSKQQSPRADSRFQLSYRHREPLLVHGGSFAHVRIFENLCCEQKQKAELLQSAYIYTLEPSRLCAATCLSMVREITAPP